MDTDEILAQFTIPTLCPIDWDEMSGDDRKRYCKTCGKHVYDLTAMSPDEIVSVLAPVREQGGELCGRVYRRPDGGLTAPERPPVRAARKHRQLSIRSLMALIAAFAAWCGFLRWASTQVKVNGYFRPRPFTTAPGSGNPTGPSGPSEDVHGAFTVEEFEQ
jgi:hypothetical protein